MEHLSPDELEAILSDAAEGVSESRLGHLAGCAECARQLAHDARLEADLHEVFSAGADSRPHRAPGTWTASLWRVALPAAAAFAILAASVRYLATRQEPAAIVPSAAPTTTVASDTPCLVDPRALGPGHDIVAPGGPCLDVVTLLGPGAAR